MRKLGVFLLGFTVILTVEWVSATSAAQGCYHPSAAKSAAPAPTSTAPMASFNADDVRKEFNASSEEVRVVALLSPLALAASLDTQVRFCSFSGYHLEPELTASFFERRYLTWVDVLPPESRQR